MRTNHTIIPARVGDLMRDFAATVGLVALLAVIFGAALGVS